VRAPPDQLAIDGHRLGDTYDGEVTVDAERLCRPGDLTRSERDRRVLAGVEDLAAKSVLDVCAIGVRRRLDPAGSLPYVE